MTTAAFLSAVIVLLIAPGPTNTLMGLAGVRGGMGAVARLLPAELAGYLAAIIPLAFLGVELLGAWPLAAAVLKASAAGWVMYLAIRLWRGGAAAGVKAVTARSVFTTTLLNPKAMVVALVLLPPANAPDFPDRLALFCLMVAGAALAWGAAGTATGLSGGQGRTRLIQRVASVWLAVVSVTLLAGMVRA